MKLARISVFFFFAVTLFSGLPPLCLAGTENGGVQENIPFKYQARYQSWKAAFLDTELGRKQWAFYENNPQFTLTINISQDNPHGAYTGKYKWDDTGRLIAATINFDSRLHEGYPNPVYYPVMNALRYFENEAEYDGRLLAATKIAHEFGHLVYAAQSDAKLYQRQTQLIPVYNKILLSNGRKVNDPRLVDLAQQMGGTPVDIWANREYWGEANAMTFLRDRLAVKNTRCSLFGKIKQSVDLYAADYTERFLKVAQTVPAANGCGWR